MIRKHHVGLVSIARACQLCGVSRSGYYAWRTRPAGRGDEVLGRKVKGIFDKSNKAYGTRRIKRELEKEGIVISRKKISRLMNEEGLVAKARRKTRATTNSRHEMPVAPNVLGRQFEVDSPNTVWVGDITYLATTEGWLYLAVVIDLYSRKVVGWSIGKRMTKALVLNALMMAIAIRKPGRGLVFHSDRGSQYCSHAYQQLLARHGFVCSMSRKGECQDNACAESLFHSLKVEWIYGEPLKSRHMMKRLVRAYIEVFYNRQRLHSKLGYLSPCDYEKNNSTFSMSA